MTEDRVPASAMVIVAHPDDAEFSMAGLIALWAADGCHVTYVLCTDGNAGSHEPGMTREKLAGIRRTEQRDACSVLGVKDTVFLGYDDGQLEPTMELRRNLVRLIRQVQPEVVLTGDPTALFYSNEYINHPDHRAAAQAAVDAVAPASAMPLLWPELGDPHRVRQLYVFGSTQATVWVDISSTIESKVAALRKHASQMGDWDPTEMIKAWGAETGKEKNMACAESYRVFRLGGPESE